MMRPVEIRRREYDVLLKLNHENIVKIFATDVEVTNPSHSHLLWKQQQLWISYTNLGDFFACEICLFCFAYAITLISNTQDFFRSLNKWCKSEAKFSIASKNTKWEKLFAIAEITLGQIFYFVLFSRVFLQDLTTYVVIYIY